MRHFVYFSGTAVTSGNFNTDELMKAGRMDIALHVIISSFFLSHAVREDVTLHLVFYGSPDPPKHIEIRLEKEKKLPSQDDKERIDISKKDLASLIKKILYKYKSGQKTEVFQGCFVEKKSLLNVVEELKENNKVFILDKKGGDIREAKIKDNCVFILGDHKGLPDKELKRLKKIAVPVTIGNKMYFASQVVAIVNNELDRRNI